MKKLRLLLFENCNRKCEGCCNNDWNLQKLLIENDFSKYDEILLTGGEPMLKPLFVIDTINNIKKNSIAKIYLYTAKLDNPYILINILKLIDGVTITLHEQNDLIDFIKFNRLLIDDLKKNKSLRLNVFKEVFININYYFDFYPHWIIKNNIEWIKNCSLPKDEIFRKVG